MTEKDSKAYMYVVECADGTLYTGYTTDVERRLKVGRVTEDKVHLRSWGMVKQIF